jgi:DNA-binding winged helix-turn-helix (wHTH) protein
MLRFGAFEINTSEGELRKKGVKLRLQGQPLRLLALLAERSGELVTREELRATLWAENTFVDFDHSLNNCIARIREVLGDSADSPRFIETVPRRGYRFVWPVEDVSERLAPAAVEQTTPSEPADGTARQRPTTGFKLWLITATVALLLVSTVIGWLYRLRQPTLRQSDRIKQWRLTAHPDEDRVLGAAISPDGKYLAFSDKTGFYLRHD